MKDICKYILAGLVVAFLYWVWVALFPSLFNALSFSEALTVGTGFFLSFELVILTGMIVAKIKK